MDGAGDDGAMITRDRIAAVFRGPGAIRPGWRLLIFFVLAFGIIGLAFGFIVTKVLRVQELEAWTPMAFLLAESVGGLGILVTLSAAAIMSRIERRTIGSYGLPWREAFRARFWEGVLWGLGAVIGLIALIGAARGVSLGGWALSGAALWQAALGWAAAMTLLGLAEEFAFRGYPLVTLAESLGFWPAAAVLSLVFGGLHYFFKPMETLADGVSVTLIGLFLCLTLRRLRSLWFAAGFHAAFDYAALVVFASPNTGNGGRSIDSHLLVVTYHGPAWLTGGPCGIEASLFVFPVIAALFVLFNRRYPEVTADSIRE